MENIQPAPYQQLDEEMTLKELILRTREYLFEVWKNKWLAISFCIPFLIWQGYVYINTPTVFPARLTFMLNEDEGGRFSGISGLLGSFGLGAPGEKNFDRILELSKSMNIISRVLLTKVKINDKSDFLGNHFIRIQKINEEKWSKPDRDGNTLLKDFLFKHDTIGNFSRREYSALKSLYGEILGSEDNKGIYGTNYNEETGIMTLNTSARSEELTIVFLETLYNRLSKFYIEKTIEKNKITYEIVKSKVDSIKSILAGTEYRSAIFEDKNNALTMNVDKVPQIRYARDKQILMILYGESIKNLEIADFALRSKMPYVQSIDLPLPPLRAMTPSKKRALLTALSLGLALGTSFIVMRKTLKSLLK